MAVTPNTPKPKFGSPEWRALYAKHTPGHVKKHNKGNKKHQALLAALALKKQNSGK